MRIFTAIFLLFAAASASAACTRPGQAPTIPNGTKADEAEMAAGRAAIQAYVNELEAFQACLNKQVEQATADVPEQLKSAWTAEGDSAVDAANVLANAYSAALKTFKEKSATPPK